MKPVAPIAFALLVAPSLAIPISAAELMPAAQQNALVQKYCAVCHTDAARNGGLSLQHFDAVTAPPSLTAMLLSKLTGGVLLNVAKRADSDASAAAIVDQRMRSGAMGAAGIPIPDKATINALIHAFAVESDGAMEWIVEDPQPREAILTASTLREIPSVSKADQAEVYRLIASCNPATQEGEVQLAWSPVAQSGTLAASVDGSAALQFRVEGSESMGNSSGVVLHGLAALTLAESKRGGFPHGLTFPAESLRISDLFPGEVVTFSFANLPQHARQEFNACFQGAASAHNTR